MAVVTSNGIVGKVRDVFPHSAQVLAINDQTSGAGVILETTRIRGILRGNENGQLEVVDILADERIKPGEKVLTAGGDMIFPRGLPVGEVEKVVRDPENDAFIDVMVTPAAHLDRLDEVLVITSTQPRFSPQEQQDLATSQTLEGAQAAAIQAQIQQQQKAAQITAEHLPGLIEPNLPPDQQPINDSSPPNPMAQPPQPLHPDQFSPSTVENQTEDQPGQTGQQPPDSAGAAPKHSAGPGKSVQNSPGAGRDPAGRAKSARPAAPGRNP